MNENKRLLIILGVVIVLVLAIFAIAFWPEADNSFLCKTKADKDYSKLASVDYDQYSCLMKENSKELLVFGELSKKEKEDLNKVAEEIGKVIYYVEDNIDSKDLTKMQNKLDYSDSSFKKDVVLVVKKGKVVDYTEDLTYDSVKALSEKNKVAKFACSITSDEEYANLGEITYDQYNCLYESEEPFAVVVAQTTCSYCTAFKPIIDQYAADNNIPVYIMEINEWKDTEKEAFNSSLEYFKDNDSWGTPLTLGIKDKKVVSEISGYVEDTEKLDSFFEELGLK